MTTFREANKNDTKKIATLHAESWRKHYRGIWNDAFLDKDVYEERMDVWERRLNYPKTNQYVLLAEKNNELLGFVCIYINDDPAFGTLVDNLHVAAEAQGMGIGKQLIDKAREKITDHGSGSHFYLWVLEENYAARKFYEHLGGKHYEVVIEKEADGDFHAACRYVW